VIRVGPLLWQIGPFAIDYGGRRRPTYARALEAFGPNRFCRLYGRSSSRVIWPRLGVAIHFDTLGGLAEPGDNACNKPEDVSVDPPWVRWRLR